MVDEPLRSNWRNATLALLRCPKCDQMNRPGIIDIELREGGQAACNACGHVWHPETSSS